MFCFQRTTVTAAACCDTLTQQQPRGGREVHIRPWYHCFKEANYLLSPFETENVPEVDVVVVLASSRACCLSIHPSVHPRYQVQVVQVLECGGAQLMIWLFIHARLCGILMAFGIGS